MDKLELVKKSPRYEGRFNCSGMKISIFDSDEEVSFGNKYGTSYYRAKFKRKGKPVFYHGMDSNYLVAALFDLSLSGYSIEKVEDQFHTYSSWWEVVIFVRKTNDMTTNITEEVMEEIYSWVKE